MIGIRGRVAAVETNNACPNNQLADEISNYVEMVVWCSRISLALYCLLDGHYTIDLVLLNT